MAREAGNAALVALHLGDAGAALGRAGESEALFRRVLAHRERVHGPESLEVGSVVNGGRPEAPGSPPRSGLAVVPRRGCSPTACG